MRTAMLLVLACGGCASSSLGASVGKARASRDAGGNLWQFGGEVIGTPRPSEPSVGVYARAAVVDGDGPGLGDGEFPAWIEAGGKVRYHLGRGTVRGFVEGELGTGVYITYEVHGAAFAARGGGGLELGTGAVGARIGARGGGALLIGRGDPLGLADASVFFELVYRERR